MRPPKQFELRATVGGRQRETGAQVCGGRSMAAFDEYPMLVIVSWRGRRFLLGWMRTDMMAYQGLGHVFVCGARDRVYAKLRRVSEARCRRAAKRIRISTPEEMRKIADDAGIAAPPAEYRAAAEGAVEAIRKEVDAEIVADLLRIVRVARERREKGGAE